MLGSVQQWGRGDGWVCDGEGSLLLGDGGRCVSADGVDRMACINLA